ncbi:hypothetical protein R1flu_017720 [Riccia fluitans]|uniref:AP2/ERF domain-containing protein n=1 Tax=Riccia fluitans TaxID=41844 RepID=A0ABD1ZDR9_9MARC
MAPSYAPSCSVTTSMLSTKLTVRDSAVYGLGRRSGKVRSSSNALVCRGNLRNQKLADGQGKDCSWRVRAGTGGVSIRRKHRRKTAATKFASVVVADICGVGTGADVVERLSNVKVLRCQARGRKTFYEGSVLSGSKELDSFMSYNTQVGVKYKGVKPVGGRFEVELQKDDILHTLIFSSQEEAAKAYDKAVYKLDGSFAETHFEVREEEKLEIQEMEWEDLL